MADEAWCRVVQTKFGTMTFVTTPEVTVSDGSTVVSLHEIPAADRDRWVDDYAAKHAPSPDGLRDGVLRAVREYGKNGRVTAIQTADTIHALYVAHLTSDAAVKRAMTAFCDNDYSVRAAILAALDGEGGSSNPFAWEDANL
jgi:hypothetical protein